jgi:hypothetical protein
MSGQFDVQAYPRAGGRAASTLVVILQHTAILGRLVIVAPLVPFGLRPVMPRTLPRVRFDGRDHALAVNELGAIDRRDLGGRVGSIAHHRDAVIRALDLLFTGF